jgi:hypothetical protein
MKAVSLFITLACAHLLMLQGREVSLSIGSLPVWLWQDAAVALLFAGVSYLIRAPRLIWAVYGVLVAYAAINVVVARVLPSPLTPPMLRAARGALSDSITEYVTVANVALCLVPLVVGAVMPVLLRRLDSPRNVRIAAVAGFAVGRALRRVADVEQADLVRRQRQRLASPLP